MIDRNWQIPAVLAFLAFCSPTFAQDEAAVAEKPVENLKHLKTTFGPTDRAFEKHVELKDVAAAWDNLDTDTMADVTLQMIEGERVLQRPHLSGITAEYLADLTIRLAGDEGDQVAIERLAKGAAAADRESIAQKATAARKLSATSRSPQFSVLPELADDDPQKLFALERWQSDIRRAYLSSNPSRYEKLLANPPGALADPLLEQLQQKLAPLERLSATARNGEEDGSENVAPEVLEKLVAASRNDALFTCSFVATRIQEFDSYYQVHLVIRVGVENSSSPLLGYGDTPKFKTFRFEYPRLEKNGDRRHVNDTWRIKSYSGVVFSFETTGNPHGVRLVMGAQGYSGAHVVGYQYNNRTWRRPNFR